MTKEAFAIIGGGVLCGTAGALFGSWFSDESNVWTGAGAVIGTLIGLFLVAHVYSVRQHNAMRRLTEDGDY